MAVKSIRYMDGQGRVILPSHIRQAANLGTGSAVLVELNDDGTIRIQATQERCAVCGVAVTAEAATIKVGADYKKICATCAKQIKGGE